MIDQNGIDKVQAKHDKLNKIGTLWELEPEEAFLMEQIKELQAELESANKVVEAVTYWEDVHDDAALFEALKAHKEKQP